MLDTVSPQRTIDAERRRLRKDPQKNKRADAEIGPLRGMETLAVTYSCMAGATLPSAQVRFTSEFGMGSGGTTPL
jgi:hypothetical protein